MLKCVSMKNLVKVYHAVHELWSFSLKDLIFTQRPQSAEMMFGYALSQFCISVAGHCLTWALSRAYTCITIIAHIWFILIHFRPIYLYLLLNIMVKATFQETFSHKLKCFLIVSHQFLLKTYTIFQVNLFQICIIVFPINLAHLESEFTVLF